MHTTDRACATQLIQNIAYNIVYVCMYMYVTVCVYAYAQINFKSDINN